MNIILWLFQLVLLWAEMSQGSNQNIPSLLEDIIRSSFNDVSMALFKGKQEGSSNGNRSARSSRRPTQAKQLECMKESMQQANNKIHTELPDVLKADAPLVVSTVTNLCTSLAGTMCGSTRTQANKRQCRLLSRSSYCPEPPALDCDPHHPYRSIDGTCNNLENKRWGAANQTVARFLKPDYGPNGGLRTGKGNKPLPNARHVSNTMAKGPKGPMTSASVMVMQWGQFLNHDMTLTPEVAGNKINGNPALMACCGNGKEANTQPDPPTLGISCLPINVRNDPFYKTESWECLRFVRSRSRPKSCGSAVMEQLNMNTAYIDASQVYGSSADVADFVRTKSGGQLKITPNEGTQKPMPPYAGILLPGKPDLPSCPFLPIEEKCFFAGDTRIDMVPGLTVMHAAFIRLHNIIADTLHSLNSYWNDEKLYQETRRIVGALAQQITYRDWLPILIGQTAMDEYNLNVIHDGSEYSDTYDDKEDATIRNAFSAAAYRLHTMPGDILKGAVEEDDFDQTGHFFNITVIQQAKRSPSSMLKGMARFPMEPIDTIVGESLRSQLFTQLNKTFPTVGLDLAAINVMRGRDHGVPAYSKWRKECKLPLVRNFKGLKKAIGKKMAKKFKKIYKNKNIKYIDLFAAGLAEPPTKDGLLGPTFTCILGRQFKGLKHGDRFWYERDQCPKPFTPDQLNAIRQTSFSSILCKVTEGQGYSFQENPFKITDENGNHAKDCSSYKFIDLSSWKE